MKYHSVFLIFSVLAGAAFENASAQTVFRAPPDAAVQKVKGKDSYGGEVYLASHADTALLKDLGFSGLEFLGRSPGSVKYHAYWPTALQSTPLPKAISGLDYDRAAGMFPSWGDTLVIPIYVQPDHVDFESEAVSRRNGEWPSRIPPVSNAGPGFSVTHDPLDVTMSDEDFRDLMERRAQATANRPNFPTSRTTPELTGTFRTTPVEDGPFHKPENVGVADPEIFGSFYFEPVERGRFHKVETVTTKDPHLTGNFQVPSYSTLRNTGIGSTSWYQKPFGTGSMNFGPSDYQPRDGYLGVGYRQFPVSYPRAYNGSIQTPDSRRNRR